MTARLRLRDTGGTLRTITRIRMRDAGGTLRTLARVRMRDEDNVLRVVFDPSGSSSLSGTPSPSTVHGLSMTGTVTTNSTTVTASGGTGPYTYAWTVLSYEAGVPPTAGSPAAATTTFTQTGMPPGEFSSSIWRCTVTDSLANTATCEVTANFVDAT